jgi:hypothetical protein
MALVLDPWNTCNAIKIRGKDKEEVGDIQNKSSAISIIS